MCLLLGRSALLAVMAPAHRRTEGNDGRARHLTKLLSLCGGWGWAGSGEDPETNVREPLLTPRQELTADQALRIPG